MLPKHQMDGAVYQWAFLSEVSGTICTSISRPFNVDPNYKSQYSRSIVEYHNYLAATSPLGPLSLTLLKEEDFFKVIIRSREGIYFIGLSTPSNLSKNYLGIQRHSVESSNCKSHFLEDILKGMKLSVPCSFLQLCQNPNLPQALGSLDVSFLYPECQFGIFARDMSSSSFQSFLRWLYHGDDDVSDDLQLDHQLDFEGQSLLFSSNASTNILIIFQEDGDDQISFIENVTANVVIVVTQETELDQLGMDVVVRTNLFHHCQHLHLPSPSLFLKTNPDRRFVLSLMVNLYHVLLSTILFSKLKSHRHTLLYTLCDEFLLTHSVG